MSPCIFPGETFVWVVVANVKRETWRGEAHAPQIGTKHFSPGARLFVVPIDQWNDDQARVFGRHRGGGRFVTMYLPLRDLENVRVTRCFDLGVAQWFVENRRADGWSEREARDLAESLRLRGVAPQRLAVPVDRTTTA